MKWVGIREGSAVGIMDETIVGMTVLVGVTDWTVGIGVGEGI